MDKKAEVRHIIVARILSMKPADRREQEFALVLKLENLAGFAGARSVLLYSSGFPEEVDTHPMLVRVLELGKRLILPRVDRSSRTLRLFQVADLHRDLIVRGSVLEPRLRCREVMPLDVDWALVPGLGFDSRCRRLGRGGGYYDRLLPGLRKDARCWALILDPQWVEELPIEPHDRPINGVADAWRSVTR